MRAQRPRIRLDWRGCCCAEEQSSSGFKKIILDAGNFLARGWEFKGKAEAHGYICFRRRPNELQIFEL